MSDFMRAFAALAARHRRARGLVGWLYCSNPFYVISADLVFIGLRMSFHNGGGTLETGALMVALIGYTLLLATTAWLLIRYGRVWDDARTILLLVVAMFLAISVSFDEALAGNPRLGRWCFVGGLLFAVAVSEGLLRGIRLRLPALYRLPYYLLLSLFFLYPLVLTPYLADPDGPTLRWLLFGFSTAAGLVFLSLLSAIRRGAAYVAKNGSPWPYPLYPWCLFGLLAIAVCGRASYLCTSFHFVGMSHLVGRTDSIFGPYFLTPFLLAIGILLVEGASVSRNPIAQRLAMTVLPGVLALTVFGHRSDPVYRGFLRLFEDTLGGSPPYFTLLAVAGLYGYAAFRRVPLALGGLAGSLLALSIVDPRTLDLNGLVAPRPLPLLAVAALELGIAIRRWQSWRFLLGATCLVAAAATALEPLGLERYQAFVAFHLAILAAGLIGALFPDALGRFLQQAAALLLAWACLISSWGPPSLFMRVPADWVRVYPLLAIALAASYAMVTGCRPFFFAAGVGLGGWVAATGWRGYCDLRRLLIGIDWIVAGLLCFALAALISAFKTGMPLRWRRRHFELTDAPRGGEVET